MIDRLGRVDELIKREISTILQEDINDPLVRKVTVTKVEVTRDLGIAKVFYTVFGDEAEKAAVAKGLKRAVSFVRGRLAKKVSLKVMPMISFREDMEEKQEEEIERLFGLIEKEHKDGTDKEERAQDE